MTCRSRNSSRYLGRITRTDLDRAGRIAVDNLGETIPALTADEWADQLVDCPDCIKVDDPADCPTCGGSRWI